MVVLSPAQTGREMFESLSRPAPKWAARTVFAVLAILVLVMVFEVLRITQMPLHSYSGALPPLSAGETGLRDRLADDVRDLSVTIGDRSIPNLQSLNSAAEYLTKRFESEGYTVKSYSYIVDGATVNNLEAVLPGSDPSLGQVVVGAHYDSVAGTVGANDNCTGVAAVLEIAELLRQARFRRTIRFVLFVNEEPPYFQRNAMGSLHYARQLRHDGVPVSAMISIETIGYYSDTMGSQKSPPGLALFYPSVGNFITFVGNLPSRALVRESIRSFRESAQFPSEGIAAPDDWVGIGWSDQWSFWQQGYRGIMVTDTAPFRYPYYHTSLDTIDKIDFNRTARVVEGLGHVVESLANSSS
jgi:Zn-dependent M28 family amino/carboxypeptidase